MPFDGIVLCALKKELMDELVEGKVERIYQPNQFEINLYVYKLGKTKKLIISANPSLPRIYITEKQKKNPEVAPNFCMILRKNLLGSKITNIYQEGLERIIRIEFETRNELGDIEKKYIVFEMMGRHSNIFLIDSNQKIIDAIKRMSFENSPRIILPGAKYNLPPVLTKKNPLEVTFEEFCSFFENSNKSLENILTDNLSGISKQFANEVLLHAQVFEENVEKSNFIKRIFESLRELLYCIVEKGEILPTLYTDKGNVVDFYVIDLKSYANFSKRFFQNLNSCVEEYYSRKEEYTIFIEKKQHLQKVIEQNLKKLSQRYEQNLQKIDEAKNADLFKKYADLILANLYQVKPSSNDFIEVTDYYSEDLSQIRIPIEKDKDLKQNAERYYKLYNKLKKAEEYAKSEISEIESELEFLSSLDALLEKSTDMEDLLSIEEELEKEGYIKTQIEAKKNEKKKDTKKPNPHHFVSSDGFDIYVGRNNIQNDYLTLKFASNNDIWLHTQKIPGSHVIIRTNNKEIPEKTLIEAACLAAYFSKAKHSSKVPVDYTYIKYVKKPPKSKPGFVIYDNFKTIIVDSPTSIDNFKKVE
ncbi:Rqc2 family fibronectin-binding protein [Caldicellulosiruptor naganoensis]|uniref:Rqc2 homolog RqcH n=1 Tax=Caldicellulosiruptor naganoensis TaxID=29324 RepID=A0ABY7BHQ1_9FIRM|nr:NFACT RNA binding domain-containing protein [Caldicellulosiruptor naganoensis]WAM32352.1 NFACT family protein [Caldicellulosiruptor naganoensis]